MGEIVKRDTWMVRKLERKQLKAEVAAAPTQSFTPADPTKPYQPPVSMDVYGSLVHNAGVTFFPRFSFGMVGMMPVLGGLIGAANMVGVTAAMGYMNSPLGMPSFVLTLTAPALFGLFRDHRAQQHASNDLKAAQARLLDHFKDWVQQRYGVAVTSANFELTEAVGYGVDTSKKAGFYDARGEEYRLHRVREGYTVAKVEERAPKEHVDLLASETAADLPGEAKLLYGHVMARLDTLRTRNLNQEQAHVVTRARTDLTETLMAWHALTDLGEPDTADEVALTQTLNVLNDELVRLVQELQATAKRELHVQRQYVTNRDVRDGVASEILRLERRAGSDQLG